MEIIAIDHIAINVKDLEKSIAFYEEILELRKVGFIHMGDHTLTYLKLTDSTKVELIHYLSEETMAQVRETDSGIYRHVCIQIDDIQKFYRVCQKARVNIRKYPSYIENLQANTMLITDPNGVEIELIEIDRGVD